MYFPCISNNKKLNKIAKLSFSANFWILLKFEMCQVYGARKMQTL